MNPADLDARPGDFVVLVHGVGVGATSFSAVIAHLERGGLQVRGHARRGYADDGRRATADLDRHVDDLHTLLDRETDGAVVLVGVSGGATLALRAAIDAPERFVGVVAHEPLIGRMAPVQREVVGARAEALADAGSSGATDFVRQLVGPTTWDALGTAGAAAVTALSDAIATEVPGFAGFDPTPDALATLAALRPVITVGDRSPAWRHEAGAIAARATGGRVVVLAECGHLAQVDAPGALAELVASVAAAVPA